MHKKIIFSLGFFAALATNSFAQTKSLQAVASFGRPRFVQARSSGVEASVIVNTVSLERTTFDLLNQKRIEKGLQALTWNDQLANVARRHSQSMAKFDFFSHRGLDDKMVSDRADAEGLTKWRAIGENIAFNRGYRDPVGRAVELWLDSSSHRRNLLDSNWKETAVGIAVTSDGSYYLTQVFLKR